MTKRGDEVAPVGKIGKAVFKHFAESECARQLFLDLGEGDPAWIAPYREVIKNEVRRGNTTRVELGSAYERSVYAVLLRNPRTRASETYNPDEPVKKVDLTPASLRAYAALLNTPGGPTSLYLLEHGCPTPPSFVRYLFDLGPDAPWPVKADKQTFYPDIVVLRRVVPTERGDVTLPVAVMPDASLRTLTEQEALDRTALELIDIKHTHEQGVGATHFIELHYYALALAAWLHENGLDEEFYVSLDGHGILPRRTLPELARLGVDEPASLTVPLRWRDTAHLFAAARDAVIVRHRASPQPIEAVTPRVQRSCGHCAYFADCTRSLQPTADPATWDVALLPTMREGTAAQLREQGYATLGDVASRIRNHPQGTTPTPIDAEVPALELKARALVAGKVIAATPENTAGERMLSIALPRYTDVALYVDLEADPTNEVVFALGLLWSVSIAPTALFRAAHDVWWRFWRDYLDALRRPQGSGRTSVTADADALLASLDPQVRADMRLDDASARALVQDFARALRALADTAGATLEISDAATPRAHDADDSADAPVAEDVGEARPFRVTWHFTYINGGSRVGGGYQDGERALAEVLVDRLADLVRLSSLYERFVARAMPGVRADGTELVWFARPAFAVFHWAREQVDHVETLLERHVMQLMNGPKRDEFLALLDWVSPQDSAVAQADRLTKVFDLREFAETSLGHPEIVSVTWHGIDCRLDPTGRRRYSQQYWAPHFNYMDFAAWHQYLQEPDNNRQTELHAELRKQMGRKLWALRRIHHTVRQLAGTGIAKYRSRPIATADVGRKRLPPDAHPLAVMWVAFSRLSAAVQLLDSEYVRSTYPLQSIAKLAAAEATGVAWEVNDKRFTFTLKGLSANAKFKEGDYALLVPETLRDSGDSARCDVVIDAMQWDATLGGYRAEAVANPRSGGHPCFVAPPDPPTRWFLYPNASDNWTHRLQSLLKRHNLQTSWLGHRLAALWRVGTETALAAPKSLSFRAQEVYLYAPTLLPQAPAVPVAPLQTTQHPPPDPSQADAIRMALAHTVSCIQGPPGTGKSQTIAALLDEFFLRRKGKRARVLVTAFSAAALRVVLQKVLDARDDEGMPTEPARSPLVWLRGESSQQAEVDASTAKLLDIALPSGGKSATINGEKWKRGTSRLDSVWGDRFVMFANAYSLERLATPSTAGGKEYELLPNGFGFDLIVVDEASQVPVSQLVASLSLVLPHTMTVKPVDGVTLPATGDLPDVSAVATLQLAAPVDPDALTRVVVVGDDNQLPPVSPIEPPERLRKVLDSAFGYFVRDPRQPYELGHAVPRTQLRRNYRSKPVIVAYTERLGLYRDGLEAFRKEHPYAPLPAPPDDVAPWLRKVLDDSVDVSTLIHTTQFETAVSPLEASLAASLCVAFLRQMKVQSAAEERDFWRDALGIVAPHNAQGRLVTRALYDALTVPGARRTLLDDEALMASLRGTIYSVEKFQGSDRTLILGTVAISSRDQLASEEAFIYDLNRFNVLTSRARQKMVLLCAKSFLDYFPRDQDVSKHAARVRDFAYGFCDRAETVAAEGPNGAPVPLTWRYRL